MIIRRELAARNVRLGHGTIWRFFAKEKLTFKNTVRAAGQDRPDMAAERMRWQEDQKQRDPKRLVLIGEPSAILDWLRTNMAPTHCRCRRDKGLYAKVPHGYWKTTTFVAALRHGGIAAPFVLDGPINGECFLAYGKEMLAPTLLEGDIVLTGNPGSHKSPKIRKAIAAEGAERRLLPRYSPDLNPIDPSAGSGGLFEIKDAPAKGFRTSVEALCTRIGELIDHFPRNACQNYFKAAGHEPVARPDNALVH